MTEVAVVTSCSAAGWEKYGAKFVESFHQHWPKNVALHVVSEDMLCVDKIEDRQVTCWPLEKSMSWRQFEAYVIDHPWVCGDGSTPRPATVAPRWLGTGYNFRFDAYKFCKKVFAIELVANYVKTGRLLWIDADVVTFADVPADLPERLLPSTTAVSCLCRVGYHSECGFVGYNLDDAGATRFINSFAELYASGEVTTLAEWHDSWVFDWLRNKLMTVTHSIPHKSKGHPFIASELGKFMDHLKGKRKNAGRTPKIEQVVHRNIDYWRT